MMMKSIYINANCQGPAIKTMLEEVLPEWRIESLAVHKTYKQAELAAAVEFMRQADVVVTQPILDTYPTPEFRSSNVRNVSRGEVITFPSIYFTGQQLTLCPLKKDGIRINAPGWAYHDSIIAALVVDGLANEAIVRLVQAVDLFDREQVWNCVEGVLSANDAREKALLCDIRLADFFRQNIADRPICHSFNHPARFVLARVCNKILDRIGISANVKDEGDDVLSFPHHPIMPSVAHHLGSVYHKEDFRCHFASKSLSFDEYVISMANAFRTVDRDDLRTSIEQLDQKGLVHLWKRKIVA